VSSAALETKGFTFFFVLMTMISPEIARVSHKLFIFFNLSFSVMEKIKEIFVKSWKLTNFCYSFVVK
jgi:hypothetical protein